MSNQPTKPAKEGDEIVFLEGMITGDGPGAIERQEARGQRQFVMSDSIPSSWGSLVKSEEARKLDDMLIQLGFRLGEPFPDDPLFRPAYLPPGWKKAGTGHSMHSDILDHRGFPRIGVFYKAAFYDRRADMYFKRRISAGYDPRFCGHNEKPGKATRAVTALAEDGAYIILASFERDQPSAQEDRDGWCKAMDEVEAEMKAWVEEHYPDYRDPMAYWDLDLDGERFKHPD